MLCCNCQANRRCVRCSCVKRKNPCVDCYPGRNRPSLCRNGSDQELSSASSQPAAGRLDSDVARQPATNATASSQPTVRHVTRTRPPVDLERGQPALLSARHVPEDEVTEIDTLERDETSPVAERSAIAKAYDEIVHWQKKFFMIPCNAVGKAFVNKLATQLQSFVDSGGKDPVALYNFMVLPTLLLQKPTDPRQLWLQGGHGTPTAEARPLG